MKILLLLTMVVCVGCSSLPSIQQATISRDTCDMPFLNTGWRLVHNIIATMPTGDMSSVIGITVADPHKLTLQSAIMTIEGLVIFDAEYDINARNKLTIKRSIKPFDSVHFAQGLMEDIRLIFFRPTTALIQAGQLSDGASVCRFHADRGNYVDVIQRGAKQFTINRYNNGYSLERILKITLAKQDGQMVPSRLELLAKGMFGYKLVMQLVSAEQVR